jgi:hypothetical protein
MIPMKPLPGADDPGAVRADKAHLPLFRVAFQEALHLHHVLRRDAVGHADGGLDAGIRGFHDRVGGEGGRHEDKGCLGARRLNRLADGVEERAVKVGLAAPPGVTPPTTLVPCLIMSAAWKLPIRPVMPWTMTRVLSVMRMAMGLSSGGFGRDGGDGLGGGLGQRVGRDERQARVVDDLAPSSTFVPARRTTTGMRQAQLGRP